jgi:oxygen-dependent protoporphyrinogen oxidase
MEYESIIIGGGISGLSTAFALKKRNKNFLLIEKNAYVGGVIQSENINGFQIEKGANTVLIRNMESLEMFHELGLLKKLILPNQSAKTRYIYKNHKLIALSTSILSTFFHPITPLHQLIAWAFKDYFSKPITNDFTVYEFFTQRFGQAFYEDLVFPMVSGIFAGEPEVMSFQYNFPKLFEFVQKQGSILKGLKSVEKPSISSELKQYWNKMFTFEGGLATLINHLESCLSKNILKNCEIFKIYPKKNVWAVSSKNEEFISPNIVISTPAYHVAQLVKELDPKFSEILMNINYHPLMVIHFKFLKANWKKPLDGFGFLKSKNQESFILGCIFNSRIFSHVAPEGFELITVMVGGATQKHLLNLEIPHLISKVKNQLQQVLELHYEPEYLSHHYWEKAIPEYTMNYHSLEKYILNFQNKYPNVHFLSNFWGGIGVPDCIQKGIRLGKAIN